MLQDIRRLIAHAEWADRALLDALQKLPEAPGEAVAEMAHVLGAAEVWLSRLEQRPTRTAVWPELPLARLSELASTVHAGYARYVGGLDEAALDRPVSYTNTAGRSFENSVGDIVFQAVLHGQYHRGKLNLRLRQAGASPVPTDYIAFVRGVPAATTPRGPGPLQDR